MIQTYFLQILGWIWPWHVIVHWCVWSWFCRALLRSLWWVMTGAVLWCGTWLSITRRESGKHKNTHTSQTKHYRIVIMQRSHKRTCFPLVTSRAVASLNTPLFPVDPNTNPLEKLKAIPIFDYQLYFQKPVSEDTTHSCHVYSDLTWLMSMPPPLFQGVAEAELEKNLERTFKLMFFASYETVSFVIYFYLLNIEEL